VTVSKVRQLAAEAGAEAWEAEYGEFDEVVPQLRRRVVALELGI